MTREAMTRVEFVRRMLADQELRKERRQKACRDAQSAISALKFKRQEKYLRKQKGR